MQSTSASIRHICKTIIRPNSTCGYFRLPSPSVVLLCVLCTVFTGRAQTQDVSDILNQISSEKETKKQTTVNSTAIQPVKASEPTEKRREKKTEMPKAKTKKVVEQPKQQPAAPQVPRIIVYRPKDKLPKDVAGSGVAGDFLVSGEDPLGGASIIAAEDAMNPFARSFIIKNVSSGYSPGTVLPLENRKLIHISPQRPLIFIGRGMLPGEYNVRAQ
ncbi:MAG: hypothetical protein NTV93_21215 [Verrucomicrobia bacterium]|nr:hypothetical protein [Verrucomicrobiota bacterium]